jgi:hypothetical protein
MPDEEDEETLPEPKQHRVYKTDHTGLVERWGEYSKICHLSWGEEQVFVNNVESYYNSILNMFNGPKLRDMLDKIIETKLRPKHDERLNDWVQQYPYESRKEEEVAPKKEQLRILFAEELLYETDQLLENNGYGSHAANIIKTFK